MAEKLDTLIRYFTFTEEDRANLIFSDASLIRLDAKRHVVELRADAFGDFPLGTDIYVISDLYQPKAVRQWLAFESQIDHVFRGTTQLTLEGFRLHDGTSQFWWNGSAWVVNTTSWNTEAEVATNIATFSATARKLRIVIRLATTDKRMTPTLRLAKIGFKAKIQYTEDIVYRSLSAKLKTDLRFIVDYAFKVAFPGGTTLDIGVTLDASKIPFSVVGVDSIFNHTTDPEHLVNLASSYDTTTRKATLTTAIPVGNMAFCQLLVAPEVVVHTTAQDFSEVEKVPAIVITGITPVDSSPSPQDDFIVNKGAGTAIVLPAPYRFHLQFTMIVLAPGGVDLARFMDAVVEFMESNKLLRSVGLDRPYRLMMRNEFTVTTRPTMSDLHSATATAQLFDVLAWKRPALTSNVYPVQRVNLAGDFDIQGPPS